MAWSHIHIDNNTFQSSILALVFSSGFVDSPLIRIHGIHWNISVAPTQKDKTKSGQFERYFMCGMPRMAPWLYSLSVLKNFLLDHYTSK